MKKSLEQKVDKQTVWLAVNSEHGERLLEIAREHVRLVRELFVNTEQHGTLFVVDDESKMIIEARIKQLENERDEILGKFLPVV